MDIDWRKHIHSNPQILGGKPVIRGTRTSVELILEWFAEGAPAVEILEAYDHLTEADVRAAVAFAHDLVIEQAAAAQKQAA